MSAESVTLRMAKQTANQFGHPLKRTSIFIFLIVSPSKQPVHPTNNTVVSVLRKYVCHCFVVHVSSLYALANKDIFSPSAKFIRLRGTGSSIGSSIKKIHSRRRREEEYLFCPLTCQYVYVCMCSSRAKQNPLIPSSQGRSGGQEGQRYTEGLISAPSQSSQIFISPGGGSG